MIFPPTFYQKPLHRSRTFLPSSLTKSKWRAEDRKGPQLDQTHDSKKFCKRFPNVFACPEIDIPSANEPLEIRRKFLCTKQSKRKVDK